MGPAAAFLFAGSLLLGRSMKQETGHSLPAKYILK
jgi:hypothetical protein